VLFGASLELVRLVAVVLWAPRHDHFFHSERKGVPVSAHNEFFGLSLFQRGHGTLGSCGPERNAKNYIWCPGFFIRLYWLALRAGKAVTK
jgi:hypothetical protein